MKSRLTGLGNTNDIRILENRRQNISLDWRGYLVPTQTDVVEHDRMEASIFELCCGISIVRQEAGAAWNTLVIGWTFSSLSKVTDISVSLGRQRFV